jgi:hypothetical protein
MLRVTAIEDVAKAKSIVNIDPYIPISFRSRSQPIGGARYIRLGDFKTQLLELQFPAESLTLSGFTVVSGQGSARGVLAGDGPSSSGLPVIRMPEGQVFSDASRIQRLDIGTNFTVSCADGQADIALGAAETFNRKVVYGRVQFLLSDDVLVGLRVVDLVDKERCTLLDYIAGHPSQGDSLRVR